MDDPALEVAPDIRAIWRQLRSNPMLRLLGADREGRLVSSCLLAIIPNLTRGGRPYGLIENVVTHADFRRRGIATALLRQALSEAWKLGCYKVMLMTGRKDEGTLRFYRRAGFMDGAKTAFIAYPPSVEISNPSPESP